MLAFAIGFIVIIIFVVIFMEILTSCENWKEAFYVLVTLIVIFGVGIPSCYWLGRLILMYIK